MDIPQGGSSSPLVPAGILKFGMLVFAEEGKADNPEKKTLGVRTRTKNQLNPHWTPGPGIKPGPQ